MIEENIKIKTNSEVTQTITQKNKVIGVEVKIKLNILQIK